MYFSALHNMTLKLVEKTLLSLINEGLETFPQKISEFKRENCEAGWRFFFGKLKSYLEIKP